MTRFVDFNSRDSRFHARVEPAGPGDVCVVRMPDCLVTTIVISPPPGGSVAVEFTVSEDARIANNTALWAPAEGLAVGGVVTALMIEALPSRVSGIRLTASVTGAVVELVQ